MGKRRKRKIPKTVQEKKDAVYELKHLIATIDAALLIEKMQGREYVGDMKFRYDCITSYLLKEMKARLNDNWYVRPFFYIRKLTQTDFIAMFKASKPFLPGLTNNKLILIYQKIKSKKVAYQDYVPIERCNDTRIFPLKYETYKKFAGQMMFEGVCDKDDDGKPLNHLTINKYRPDYEARQEGLFSACFCYADTDCYGTAESYGNARLFSLRFYKERYIR